MERPAGTSEAFREAIRLCEMVARSSVSVYLHGATGTGKEVLAKWIHYKSERKTQSFIVANCSGIPETLFEAEFFGVTKGAFTDAKADRAGLFEQADRGTIFLDEIGDLPGSCQAKLLRVLETGRVRRLGSENERTIDCRVICATHRDLRDLVKDGSFREDLFWRLNVFRVAIPPLSERMDDIPSLAKRILDDGRLGFGCEIDDDSLAYLNARSDWPGNVRQLRNEIMRATVFAVARAREGGSGSPKICAADFGEARAVSHARAVEADPLQNLLGFSTLDRDIQALARSLYAVYLAEPFEKAVIPQFTEDEWDSPIGTAFSCALAGILPGNKSWPERTIVQKFGKSPRTGGHAWAKAVRKRLGYQTEDASESGAL